MDYSALKTEILADPISLGYAGVSDYGVSVLMNDATIGVGTITRGKIQSHEVIDATDPLEWASLTAQEKQRYQVIVSAGLVNTDSDNVKNSFLAMFPAGSVTRAALVAIVTRAASRAEILFGRGVAVTHEDVAIARAL